MKALVNTLLLALIAGLLTVLVVVELDRRGSSWQDEMRLDLFVIQRNVYAMCLELTNPPPGEPLRCEAVQE